jgi:hypothetical protein
VQQDEWPLKDWKRECQWEQSVYSADSQPTGGNGDISCSLDEDADTQKKTLHTVFPDRTSFYVRVKNKKRMQRLLMLLTYDSS